MRINTVSCEEEFVRKAVLWPAAEGKALWAGEVGRGRMDHEDSSFSKAETRFSWKQGGGASIT